VSLGSQLLAISIWNENGSKELAESLGANILLDKMKLANSLIPAIMQCKHTDGTAAAFRNPKKWLNGNALPECRSPCCRSSHPRNPKLPAAIIGS
jgi:hypothetical protein